MAEGNLAQETRNFLIYLVGTSHTLNHRDEPEAWRDCRNALCQATRKFLDDTNAPETAAHDRITELVCSSIYGAKTKRGLVEIKVGGAVTHVRPREARAHAMALLEAAEAAESDEFLMNWLAKTVGLDSEGARAAILQQARAYRLQMGRRDDQEEEASRS